MECKNDTQGLVRMCSVIIILKLFLEDFPIYVRPSPVLKTFVLHTSFILFYFKDVIFVILTGQ